MRIIGNQQNYEQYKDSDAWARGVDRNGRFILIEKDDSFITKAWFSVAKLFRAISSDTSTLSLKKGTEVLFVEFQGEVPFMSEKKIANMFPDYYFKTYKFDHYGESSAKIDTGDCDKVILNFKSAPRGSEFYPTGTEGSGGFVHAEKVENSGKKCFVLYVSDDISYPREGSVDETKRKAIQFVDKLKIATYSDLYKKKRLQAFLEDKDVHFSPLEKVALKVHSFRFRDMLG